MREITAPLQSFAWPYVTFRAREPGFRKLSPAQRRAVESMREGVWYEPARGGPLPATLYALVLAGWCRGAEIGRRGPDGRLARWTGEELLLHAILDQKPKLDQPFFLYRLVDGARGQL